MTADTNIMHNLLIRIDNLEKQNRLLDMKILQVKQEHKNLVDYSNMLAQHTNQMNVELKRVISYAEYVAKQLQSFTEISNN